MLRLQSCAAPAFAQKHGITQGVEIVGQAMATDLEGSWDNPIDLIGAKMTAKAAQQAYTQAGLGPEEVDVVELHDCFYAQRGDHL